MSSSGNRDVLEDVFLWILLYWWARLSDVRPEALTLFACEGEDKSAVRLLLVYLRFAIYNCGSL